MPIVANNTFYGNRAREGAGIRFCYFLGSIPEPNITNNLIYRNTADSSGGGIAVYAADPDLRQTTIDANSAPKGGGVYVYDNGAEGPATFGNSVITNSAAGGGVWKTAGGLLTTSYCDVWNNTGGDYVGCVPDPTDLSGDPEYCETADDLYRIYETSPCVGSGQGGFDIGCLGVGCFHTPNVIFYDNWSDQIANGWEEHVVGEGSWQVVSGRYNGGSNPLVGGYARSIVDTLDAADFTFQVEVCPMSPIGTTGLLFRFDRETDPPSTYRVRLDTVWGWLERETPSGVETLAEFPCGMPIGQSCGFLLRATAGQLEGWFRLGPGSAGIRLFVVWDESPLLRGSVGMDVQGGGCASFDNVLVARAIATGVAGADEGRDRGIRSLFVRAIPNPFRERTEVGFTLGRSGAVHLAVYNVGGELVRTLAQGVLDAGPQHLMWDGRDEAGVQVGSGVYLIRLETEKEVRTRKAVLRR